MDNQNKAMFCPNLLWHGSEKLGLVSTVTHMQPENYIVPDLTSLKPLSQAAFFFETVNSTSAKNPGYPNSQMFYAESFTNPNSVGVGVAAVTPPTEECKVGNVIEASSCYSQALESAVPFLKFQASVIGSQSHRTNVQDLGKACNGLLSGKMKLEPAASCQKKFILFDQTGSTGRIIFHPSQYSMLLPNSPKPMKEINAQSRDRNEVPIKGNYLDWKTGCPAYTETLVASAFAALQKTRADRLNSISLGNFGEEFISESPEGEEESTSRVCYHRLKQERTPISDSDMHEDTEDLEALLSSDDDENSTGRSPSDITVNNGDTCVEDDFADVTSGVSAKRRRMDTRGNGEDEVDLIPVSAKEHLEKLMIDEKCLSCDISYNDASSWEPVVQPEYLENVKDDNRNDILLCGHSSHGISDECSSKTSGNEHIQTSKCFSRQSGSSKNWRKENIKRTVKLLRSIIPGGNAMETAIVLEEAIQYVKVLQLKVKGLEANEQRM